MPPKVLKGVLQGSWLLWRYVCWMAFYVFIYLATRPKK